MWKCWSFHGTTLNIYLAFGLSDRLNKNFKLLFSDRGFQKGKSDFPSGAPMPIFSTSISGSRKNVTLVSDLVKEMDFW